MAGKTPQSAELFSVPSSVPAQGGRRPGRRVTGRHERALERAVKAAELEAPVSAAAVSLARSLAWALDTAELKVDPYAVSQVAPRYLETLEALGLDGSVDDDDDEGFGGLGGPA